MAISATSAAVSSFAGLRGLAVVAGWPVTLAPLLPLTVDAYAMTATRVWLARSTRSARARRFARTNSALAILLSLIGNATYHLVAAGLLTPNWVVVVVVGAVPALVLSLTSHLAVLRAEVDPAGPAPDHLGPEAGPSPDSGRREDSFKTRSDAELLAEARSADAARRATFGRGISRDGLRRELHIGGGKATALLRQLKAEQVEPSEVSPPA